MSLVLVVACELCMSTQGKGGYKVKTRFQLPTSWLKITVDRRN